MFHLEVSVLVPPLWLTGCYTVGAISGFLINQASTGKVMADGVLGMVECPSRRGRSRLDSRKRESDLRVTWSSGSLNLAYFF